MSEVTVRAFEMADWEDVAELYLAPNCCWGTLQLPYQSRDDIKKRLETPRSDRYRLVAILNETQKIVGLLNLHTNQGRRAHVGGIGMFVHDDYQNQGIGSKLMEAMLDLAENWLNLKRIELTVYTDNAPAIHLYEKYGFAIEGTMRKYALRDSQYVDVHAMAKISEDI